MRGRTAFLLCCSAAVAGLIPAALVVAGALPVAALLFSAQALVVTAIVWALLHRRCSTGSAAATTAAWTVAGLAAAWGVLGAASVGFGLLLPAALLLAAAAATPASNVHESRL